MEFNNVDEIVKDNIRVNALLSSNVNELIEECQRLLVDSGRLSAENKALAIGNMENLTKELSDKERKLLQNIESRSSDVHEHLERIMKELNSLNHANCIVMEQNHLKLKGELYSISQELALHGQLLEQEKELILVQATNIIQNSTDHYNRLSNELTLKGNELMEVMVANQQKLQKENKRITTLIIVAIILGISCLAFLGYVFWR